MTESLSAIPSGVRYYFGDDAHLRRAIEHTAMSIFKGWSYEEITPPTVDYYSLFERGMGAMAAQKAFRLVDTDGKLLALRPDVTSSIARAAATLMSRRPRPLRFSYAAQVFHLQAESHAEWRRESTQIGCELIGQNSLAADMEILAVAAEVLSSLGLAGNFTITINDLGIFSGIVETMGVDPATREELRLLVNSHNASDLNRRLTECALSEDSKTLVGLVQLSGKTEIFAKARQLMTNQQSAAALERLEALWKIIESLNLSTHFALDLGDVSRLDYYTGLVFKIYVAGLGTRLGGGGRYDLLTANFGKPEPAVGFVLDLDGLTEAMRATRTADFGVKNEPEASVLSHEEPIALFLEALQQRASGNRVLLNSLVEVKSWPS